MQGTEAAIRRIASELNTETSMHLVVQNVRDDSHTCIGTLVPKPVVGHKSSGELLMTLLTADLDY